MKNMPIFLIKRKKKTYKKSPDQAGLKIKRKYSASRAPLPVSERSTNKWLHRESSEHYGVNRDS